MTWKFKFKSFEIFKMLKFESKFDNRSKAISFDFDSTIIKTKSGNVFPKDENDWKYINDNIFSILKKLSSEYNIVIFSNQLNLKDSEKFNQKLNNVFKDIPFVAYVSIDNDIFRKPRMGLYEQFKKDYNCEICCYVGDAAGRIGDFSDTDYKFALNCELLFLTPEELFSSGNKVLSDENFEKFILEQQFFKSAYPIPKHPLNDLNDNDIDRTLFGTNDPFENKFSINTNKQEIIMLIGSPGSGKSTFANKYSIKYGYEIISQDLLKNSKNVIKKLNRNFNFKEQSSIDLNNKKSVIIDRCNAHIKSRKEIFDIAEKMNSLLDASAYASFVESLNRLHYTHTWNDAALQHVRIFNTMYSNRNHERN